MDALDKATAKTKEQLTNINKGIYHVLEISKRAIELSKETGIKKEIAMKMLITNYKEEIEKVDKT